MNESLKAMQYSTLDDIKPALFRYFIVFKKKYTIINGFDEAYKVGRKREEYALCVEKIEFTI